MTFTIDSSAWYYSLSTIAQTCGAVLAISGTFVVFKLDKIQKSISNYRGRVVEIIKIWRQGGIPSDAFYDETDGEVLDKYHEIVDGNINNEAIFDRSELLSYYCLLEGISMRHGNGDGSFNLSNGTIWNRDFCKRWSNRMADLMSRNIQIKKDTLRYLKYSLLLLTMSIMSSIALLPLFQMNAGVGVKTLVSVVIFALFSIGFTSVSVWQIARRQSID